MEPAYLNTARPAAGRLTSPGADGRRVQAFLTGDRVELHAPTAADAAFVHRVSIDDRVWPTGFTPVPRSRGAVADFLREEANDDGRVDLLVRVPTGDGGEVAGADDRAPGDDPGTDDDHAPDDDPETRRGGMVSLTDVDYRRSSAEVGYWLAPAVQGHGYATEAVGRVAAYAFDTLGLARLEAHVDAPNEASVGVLESVGFVREGTRREVRRLDGNRVDAHVYGLLAREWTARD